jgi:hypothetical protein
MTRLRVVVAVALLAPAAVTTADAHQGNPNYRSVISAVTPPVPGLRVQVLNLDDRLELQNTSGKTVVIEGYDGEPYARLLADRTVEVNERSPAFYLNDDRFAAVKVPKSARSDAPAKWHVIDRAGRFDWHDHRIHWMAKSRPPQVKDASARTKIFDWKVPIRVDGSKATVAGTLFWQPNDSKAPTGAYTGLAALALLGAGVVILVRRRRRVSDGHPEQEAW